MRPLMKDDPTTEAGALLAVFARLAVAATELDDTAIEVAHEGSVCAEVLRPGGVVRRLASTPLLVLPSTLENGVGTPVMAYFGAQ